MKNVINNKAFISRNFWITIGITVIVMLSIFVFYVVLVQKATYYGWQQVLCDAFFMGGLIGGVIFVLAHIIRAVIMRNIVQRKETSLTKKILVETIVCFVWGAISFGLAWIAKEKLDLGLLLHLYPWCFLGVIIGADSLRRISRSRIAWQVILVFVFFIAIYLIINSEGYDTTITKVYSVMFLFMLTYIFYYSTFGIRALREPSKRTGGLESMKKLTSGIFCFWFLWALPLYSERFSYNNFRDISITVISIIVFISVLFCLGGRHLKDLSGKEIIYVLITVVGMLLSISPQLILMGLVTY